MTEIDELIRPAFKYLSAESENICRLCFGTTDGIAGVHLDDRRLIQCHYYDNTVSFMDILADFGATTDPSLPQMLCEYCADTAISSFLFLKLCHQSHDKWDGMIETFKKTINHSETLNPTVKTAYMVLQNDNSTFMLTSRTILKNKTKEVALEKIQNLIKARQAYKKVKKKVIVICEECGEKVYSRRHLARHMLIHSRKKSPCTQCPKVFKSKVHLHNHMERVHKPKIMQCPKCSKMFSSEKLLKNHDSTHHIAAICKRCFIQFPSKKDLQKHTEKHDINKCPRCNKEIYHKPTFKTHLKNCGNDEAKELKFRCDICNKGYAGKNGLRSHLITFHGFGKVYRCNWCKKPFDAMSKMKSHVVKHTRERNYHCDMCGGQFVTQAALIYHVRIHTGERPYPCDLCEESFTSASRRMEHKRRKHWGPSRECPVCHSKFVTGHELRKHVARHKNPQSRLFVRAIQPDIDTLVKHVTQ